MGNVVHIQQARMERLDDSGTTIDSGYIRVFRSLQDVSFSSRPEYMSAWLHILLLATHKPRKTMIGNTSVLLREGQFVSGRKALAERVGVSEKQMRSILDFFEKEGMITKDAFRLGTVFTVCKYSEYNGNKGQEGPRQKGQEKDQQKTSSDAACSETKANERATKGPTERATTQEHNNISIPNGIDLSHSPVSDHPSGKPTPKRSSLSYPDEFEWIWSNRPRREGSDPKRKAFQACNARIQQGATWHELAKGMRRYLSYCEAKGTLNTEFVMQAVTFFGPDEHFKNDWVVNHGQTTSIARPVTGTIKQSAADRQHAAAAAYLAGLQGECRGENRDESVVVSYE